MYMNGHSCMYMNGPGPKLVLTQHRAREEEDMKLVWFLHLLCLMLLFSPSSQRMV